MFHVSYVPATRRYYETGLYHQRLELIRNSSDTLVAQNEFFILNRLEIFSLEIREEFSLQSAETFILATLSIFMTASNENRVAVNDRR